MSLNRIDDVVNDLFALSNNERIDEGIHWLGIHGGVSAGDDDGVTLVPFLCAEGNTAKVEDVEGVGVQRLIREGKTN
jgi:hypothetical protein